MVHFKRSAKLKLKGGFEPTPQFRANICLNPGRPCGRPAVTLTIAVASLLEKLNLKETEKNTILASLADAQLKVCKRPVARLQATVQQQSVVSQRAKCVQWSAPEFFAFGKPPRSGHIKHGLRRKDNKHRMTMTIKRREKKMV